MSESNVFLVDEPGVRIDKFLADRQPQTSRSYIQKLIEDGRVTVNGKIPRSGMKLKTGDSVELNLPPPPPSPIAPVNIPVTVIYEDKDFIAVDKPFGMSVHPSPGQTGTTLINVLMAHIPELGLVDDSMRPGIVHRLDKDTSGVILVAKTKAAQMNLVEQFKERTVKKVYITLVEGNLKPDKGTIEAAIGRDPINRQRMAVTHNGREARTEYRVLKYLDKYTLLEVTPKTGRTHQIRVHLAAVGYPVVGDGVYGSKSKYLKRQFLHAHKIGIKLPSTGEYREFVSELAPDLQEALDEISAGLPAGQ